MPLDRKFPNNERFKISFDTHPPLYVFWDNDGRWNVDTRYITTELRTWLEENFEMLFNVYHPELFADEVVKPTEDDLYGLFLLHVVITNDVEKPAVILTYSDHSVYYEIPATRTRFMRTDCDAILDDFRRGSTSSSFQ